MENQFFFILINYKKLLKFRKKLTYIVYIFWKSFYERLYIYLIFNIVKLLYLNCYKSKKRSVDYIILKISLWIYKIYIISDFNIDDVLYLINTNSII